MLNNGGGNNIGPPNQQVYSHPILGMASTSSSQDYLNSSQNEKNWLNSSLTEKNYLNSSLNLPPEQRFLQIFILIVPQS